MKSTAQIISLYLALTALAACKDATPPAAVPTPEKRVDAAPAPAPAPAAPTLPPLIDGPGLAKLIKDNVGKPVVINVFASWCTPCKQELPDLAKLAARYPRVVFIGIDVDEKTDELTKFLPTVPKAITVYRRPDGFATLLPALHLPKDWNDAVPPGWATSMPLTLVFEASGEFGTGSVGQLGPEAIAEITRIAEPAPAKAPVKK